MEIKRLCYELYKIDWKPSHMITVEREMDAIKDYYEGLVNDDTEYTYDDYIEEFGYDGELYVCYEEFCNTEYNNEEYMCELLDNERLISLYRKDIGTFSDGHECEDRDETPPKVNKELIILERSNGWYGGYEKTKNGYEQLFNTSSHCLFMDIKDYTDKGYTIRCVDKSQEETFMKDKVTLEEFLKCQ